MQVEESAELARIVLLAFLTQISPELTVGEVIAALNKCALEIRTLN